MCGYCTEVFALAALTTNRFPANRRRNVWARALWLQELPDLNLLSQEPGRVVCVDEAIVWIGRAAQVLIKRGFNAPGYQTFLTSPRFLNSIDTFCDPARRSEMIFGKFQNVMTPFDWLTNRDTWLHQDVFANQVAGLSNHACAAMIGDYAARWLGEDHVELHDLDTPDIRVAALVQIFGTSRPIQYWLIPLLVSIGVLGSRPVTAATVARALWPILHTRPALTPCFEALELWIERQAAQAAFALFGIEPFAQSAAIIRAEIFQYLALIGAIGVRDQSYLHDAISENDEWPNGDFFSLRDWLVEGDLLQSLRAFSEK